MEWPKKVKSMWRPRGFDPEKFELLRVLAVNYEYRHGDFETYYENGYCHTRRKVEEPPEGFDLMRSRAEYREAVKQHLSDDRKYVRENLRKQRDIMGLDYEGVWESEDSDEEDSEWEEEEGEGDGEESPLGVDEESEGDGRVGIRGRVNVIDK